MGWWAEFTGKAGAQRAQAAAGEANKYLDQGYGEAFKNIGTSRTSQLDALKNGYSSALGNLDTAEGKATDYLNQGADAGKSAVSDYYGRAQGNVQDYYNRTQNLLNPYINGGSNLMQLYNDALGGNGQSQQQSFYDSYQGDPFRQYRDEAANRAMQAQFNAKGQSGSGRFTQAVSRASLERGSQDMNTYLQQLLAGGQMGQQSASQLANINTSTGNTLAGLNTGMGDKISGIELNRGSNLANLASQYGNARAGYNAQWGQNNAGVEDAYGRTMAGLNTGLATAKGGNLMGGANAANASINGGMNNIFGMAGTIVKGFTPSQNGKSAFDNMFSW